MSCPKCGSDLWDNAVKVAGGWRGPLLKCKNQGCDWVQWPPKGQKAPQQPAGRSNGPRTGGSGPKWTWPTLHKTYTRCLVIAQKEVREAAGTLKTPLLMADVLSAAATLFIAATRDGVQEIAPKPPEPAPDQIPDEEASDRETFPY